MNHVLGIDVGGTKIASALVDQGLELKNLEVTNTSQIDLVRQLIDLIRSQKNFDAIGLAMPGPVLSDGTVVRLPNVPRFARVNLKHLLEETFKVPVAVVNDAKAFAFAEAMAGQAQENKVAAGVVLGTGIGVGIVIDRKIYDGKDGIAGEFEHVTLLDGKLFRELRHAAGRFQKASDAKLYLKTLLDMIILSFNPDVIILGGGWANLPGMEDLASELAVNVGDYENRTAVKVSKLQYPSLVGAALLALEQQKVK
ncbi:MAG: ROK family protein [Candidatus Doudnabacteria bacterium]|nr:ROK family protein [Candidatus Doudnabacteria bacterium]